MENADDDRRPPRQRERAYSELREALVGNPFGRYMAIKVYQKYFLRTKYERFWHVTLTPIGNNVSSQDFINRVNFSVGETKSLLWHMLVPEISEHGVFHFHGFMMTKTDSKFEKFKKNDVMVLTARQGSREGWLRYMMKGNPEWFLEDGRCWRLATHWDRFDKVNKTIASCSPDIITKLKPWKPIEDNWVDSDSDSD